MSNAQPLVTFTPLVKAYLRDASGLQPYLLQLLCNHLYATMISSGRDEATTIDVDEVIDRDIVPNQYSFTDYDRLILDDDRPLLRAVALAQKAVVKRRRFVTSAEVVRELHRMGVESASADAVANRLRELVRTERPLVSESGDYKGNFRLVIGLLADHLVRRTV